MLIELREFDAKIRKQNRELAVLQEKHDEKKSEMEKLGKDCKKIVCRTSLFIRASLMSE